MTFDFAQARENMIENDVRTNDVTDRLLIAALRAVAREAFVPADKRELAYAGMPVPVGEGRHLLDARSFAKLVQAARVTSADKVLDVGCATGYSSAVLARLGGQVVALESNESLAKAAQVAHAGLANVRVVRGDLAKGAREAGPYDVILLNGAVEEVPDVLTQQLKEGGRLLAIVASGAVGSGQIFTKVGGVVSPRKLFDAWAPLLPGFARAPTFVF